MLRHSHDATRRLSRRAPQSSRLHRLPLPHRRTSIFTSPFLPIPYARLASASYFLVISQRFRLRLSGRFLTINPAPSDVEAGSIRFCNWVPQVIALVTGDLHSIMVCASSFFDSGVSYSPFPYLSQVPTLVTAVETFLSGSLAAMCTCLYLLPPI